MSLTPESLSAKLDALIAQYNYWRDSALADGRITLDETAEGQQQATETLRDLRALKKEINLAIRGVRQEYREAINDAGTKFFGGKYKQGNLRLNLPYALEPYQRLLVSVDSVILNLDTVKQAFKDTLAEAKIEAATEQKTSKTLKAKPESALNTTPPNTVLQYGVDPDDIRAMMKKWEAILEETQKRVEQPNLRPEELQFRNGIIRALGLVVDDLSEIVSNIKLAE